MPHRSSVTSGAVYISQTPANDYRDFEKWDPNILEEHVAIILELSPRCINPNIISATGSLSRTPSSQGLLGGGVRSFLQVTHDATGRPTRTKTPGGVQADADADIALSYTL